MGVVEKDKILSSEKVQVGDVVLGLQSIRFALKWLLIGSKDCC